MSYPAVFKNLYFGSLIVEGDINFFEWDERIKALAHQPIREAQDKSAGFAPVLEEGELPLIYHANGFVFLLFLCEQRVINKRRFQRLVSQRKRKVAAESDRRVNDLTVDEVKFIEARITEEMRLRTEPRDTEIALIIDTQTLQLFSNTQPNDAFKQALDLIKRLEPKIGDIKNTVTADLSPSLTSWLFDPDSVPEGVSVGEAMALQRTSGSTLPPDGKLVDKTSMSAADLSQECIRNLVAGQQRVVTKMGLHVEELGSFVLTNTGEIRGLVIVKPEDLEEAKDEAHEHSDLMVINGLFCRQILAWLRDTCACEIDESDRLHDHDGEMVYDETPQQRATTLLPESSLDRVEVLSA